MIANQGNKRASMRDMVKHLGASHVTVSPSMHDDPRISPETRARVKQAAVFDYRPDPMLHALGQYRLNKVRRPIRSCIAWINAWSPAEKLRGFSEFDLYWQGAHSAAGSLGYRLEEFRIGDDITPKRLNEILATRGVPGILLPPQFPQPDWGNFPWENYAVVRFGRSLSEPKCNIVTAAQVANAMLAFAKIRELGYRRTGFVTHDRNSCHGGHLLEAGFLAAQSQVTASERVPLCFTNDSSVEASVRQIVEWADKFRVDAIFTDNTDLAEILNNAGIRVPEDIGLAVTTVFDGPACPASTNTRRKSVTRR
jgi:LacI family transcriptional regulator